LADQYAEELGIECTLAPNRRARGGKRLVVHPAKGDKRLNYSSMEFHKILRRRSSSFRHRQSALTQYAKERDI
jgi:hypothetical protein